MTSCCRRSWRHTDFSFQMLHTVLPVNSQVKLTITHPLYLVMLHYVHSEAANNATPLLCIFASFTSNLFITTWYRDTSMCIVVYLFISIPISSTLLIGQLNMETSTCSSSVFSASAYIQRPCPSGRRHWYQSFLSNISLFPKRLLVLGHLSTGN